MAYKLTPDVRRHLRELADAIQPGGPTPPPPSATLTGAELRARFGLENDRKGRPIQDANLYLAAAAPAINHLRRLEQKYEAGGPAAVERYLEPFKKPAALRQLEQQPQPAAALRPAA